MVEFLNPEAVLNSLSIKKAANVAEFGCGSGEFALRLAKRAQDGIIYAFDIQEEPLVALKRRADRAGAYNLRTKRCDLEQENGSGLPPRSLDVVLIPNVLFQAEDKESILKEAFRTLKNKGQLLIVEWKPESLIGPEKSWRLSKEEAKGISENIGFELEKEIEAGSHHWALLFQKP